MIYESYKVTYHSIEIEPNKDFFTETLIIKKDGISYKKEWESNRRKNESELISNNAQCNSLIERDYSWIVKFNYSDCYERIAEELRNVTFQHDDKRFELDGDTTILEIVDLIDGRKVLHKESFSLCSNDRFRRQIRLSIEDFIKDVSMPEFLNNQINEKESK